MAETLSITVGAANKAPTVSAIAWSSGTASADGQRCTFSATANDPEDGDLSSAIAWSSNLDGELGEGATVRATLSEGLHAVTAWVKDSGEMEGRKTRSVQVDSFNEAPALKILEAIGGAFSDEGQVFEFSAVAEDPEDGDLSGSIQWASDTDGTLGTGSTLKIRLSEGKHTLGVSVTDSQGKSTSQKLYVEAQTEASINLKVSSYNFYRFKIVNLAWSGATTDVDLIKDGRKIGTGSYQGSKYFWAVPKGEYKVCEQDRGLCSEIQTLE